MPAVMLGALPDAYALAVLQGMHRQTDRRSMVVQVEITFR